MPLNNRYVVAALDNQGKEIAYLSPTDEWVTSVLDAVCFPSQIDTKHFIAQNSACDDPDISEQILQNFDHVQAVFVTVKKTATQQRAVDNEDDVSFTGIFG